MHIPTIIIAGRMNVGKSTLFNRVIGGKTALVSPVAGTTRDWREAKTEWRGEMLRFIDTGGVEWMPQTRRQLKEKQETMQDTIERVTKRVLVKADCIVFVVDGKEGLLPQDRTLARIIVREKKPVLLVVNKIDRPRDFTNAAEFWKLGLGEPHPIAALTGVGVGDLLDTILVRLSHPTPRQPHLHPLLQGEERGEVSKKSPPLRIAVIGKPNVGKSSLVNAILGEERVIVSPVAGTTREPIDTDFERDKKQYTLIDTAGIRRHAERTRTLEAAGVARTIDALKRADVALLVFESHEALASQDLRIAGTLVDANVGVVIIANKWDLFHESQIMNHESSKDITKKYTEHIRRQMPHIAWAPILFIAAKTGRNVQKILSTIDIVASERGKIILDKKLDAWFKRLTYRPHKGNRNVRSPHIYGIKQISALPPTFELVTEFKIVPTKRGMQKETVRDSYVRFLENQLRASFDFTGTPIIVKLRTIE